MTPTSSRTGIIGWQQERWWVCCNDAALFLGPVGKAALQAHGNEAVAAIGAESGFATWRASVASSGVSADCTATKWAIVVSDLAYQIYFAASAELSGDKEADARAIEKRLRLLDETKEAILELGMSGIVKASDHILDVLERYLSDEGAADPARVLSMFLSVARSAVDNGYQVSSSGFGVIDRTIRWYILAQPDLLRSDENLNTLSQILDSFLDEGWPDAFRLARDLRQLR